MATRRGTIARSVLLILGFVELVQGKSFGILHRPDPDNASAMARWLVASNSWGVLRYCLSILIRSNFSIPFYIENK